MFGLSAVATRYASTALSLMPFGTDISIATVFRDPAGKMKLLSENLAQELDSLRVFPAEVTPFIVAASTIESEIN